jgi:hypothetical protein
VCDTAADAVVTQATNNPQATPNPGPGVCACPAHLDRCARSRRAQVSLPSTVPLLYCFTKEQIQVQSTKPAKVSGSGSFRATVDQRFVAGPGEPAIVQVISGRFSGGTVTGTIHTEAAECSGSTTFSASAR